MNEIQKELKKESEEIVKEEKKVVKKANEVFEKTGKAIEEKVEHNRKVFQKHRFWFGLFGTIGISSVIAGFEVLALKVQILNNHPYILILFGFSLLFIIGALYERLMRG